MTASARMEAVVEPVEDAMKLVMQDRMQTLLDSRIELRAAERRARRPQGIF